MRGFTMIALETNEYLRADGSHRKVDQVRLTAFDITFYSDLRSERDERLAKRMADALSLELYDNRKTHNAA